jgi:four helix bundle protein
MISNFPKHELYGLGNQLRRAIISVQSNIAEGTSRYGKKEKIHFINIAYGSLMESVCQMSLAKDLGYISKEEYSKFEITANKIAIKINNFIKSIKEQMNC